MINDGDHLNIKYDRSVFQFHEEDDRTCTRDGNFRKFYHA